jgi:hypothetical protein
MSPGAGQFRPLQFTSRTTQVLGLAMIEVAREGRPKSVLESRDIATVARKHPL